jgi:hypothetical protein
MLICWLGYLGTFSPPKGENSSVRATLQSESKGLILARENQSKITKLKQKKDLHLARENQREFSKVPLARPHAMYKSCVTM